MNKKPFGLDIGATTIKLVWLERLNNGFAFKSALKIPTPLKGMLSESPLDQEEMAQTIQKAVLTANITTKQVNLALPENQVYTKVLEMPTLTDRELRSAIYWEAEQHIPVPLASITLTWSVLKRAAKPTPSDKMLVLLVGAPNMLIGKYQKIVQMVGLEMLSLETEILSATRSIVSGPDFPPTLIINIGAVSTSLAIVRDAVLVFTYSVALGGTAINRAIASDFGFTTQQAEEYKKLYGISDQSLGGKIGKATTPVLNAILAEAKKSLAYYSQRYTDLPIRQVQLSGGTAKLPGIDLFFAQNLGVEVVLANPWKVLIPSQIPKELVDDAPDYAVSVGLAMRDYE